ncbi:MAG TPA: hypothetical protein VFY05_06825 [Candidatus Angelobacter sp.]|nr:hypothetical protein [Candidatus Angelobacter sp.]
MIPFKTSLSKSLYVFLLSLAVASIGLGANPPALPAVPTTVDSITATEMRGHLEFLSSTELGGRYTLSPNFPIVARYLASELEAYGFRGAVPHGSFLQKFEVVSTKIDATGTALHLKIDGKDEAAQYGLDFFGAPQSRSGEVQGQIVFVGAGISSPEQKHDDYAGKDVKGKIVVVVAGVMRGVDASKLSDRERGLGAAESHGAAGMLIIPPQRFLNRMRDRSVMERFSGRETVQLAKDADAKLVAITLGPRLAEKVLAGFGLKLSDAFEGRGGADSCARCSARLSVALQQTRLTTQNVAGILDGTDPHLRDEYVTFSAH